MLGNDLLRAHHLSFCARGLLAYLLSLPDASREDVRTLAAKSVEGRTRIAAALRELEAAGHYVRRTARDPITGQVGTRVDVYELPTVGKLQHSAPPLPANPAAGGRGPGKTAVGKAGSPSLTVRTPLKDVENRPSAPLTATEADEDWEVSEEPDPTELAEAQEALYALLGGAGEETSALTPESPAEPAQSPPAAAPERSAVPRPTRTSEGIALLLEIGQLHPQLALSGRPLTDQGAMVEGLLAAGWPRAVLRAAISAPLPATVYKSVGAIIAARIAAFPVNPPAEMVRATAPEPHTSTRRPPGAPPRLECDGCRAPGLPRPGLCPACRGEARRPAPMIARAELPAGGWRERVAAR
ncbi:HAD family hydrolase [Kitasatospora fiedleri]|uniref:hypothetical protein n=1 Tax=Kitasatospora fiedleri TaxID=2991545 RepID=UPI00249B112E|nr:hypothetical protein [Kitasatospora fiedleri]